jgi:hypothetical protein
MTTPLYFYLLDADGWRVLATPLRLMPNSRPSLVELDAQRLEQGHYAKVRADAEHFHPRGARAALIYQIDSEASREPDLLATLWLQGPLSLKGE